MAAASDSLPMPCVKRGISQTTKPLDRRGALGALASAPVALAGPVVASTPADTDRELVEAWNLWLAQMRETQAPPDSRTNEEWDALWDDVWVTEDRIAALPASGLTGLVVKMRLVLHNQFLQNLDASEAFVLDGVMIDEAQGEAMGCLLWSAIEDAERLAGGRAAA